MCTSPDQDRLADRLAIDILLAAFGPLGVTAQACNAAAETVLASYAFGGNLEDIRPRAGTRTGDRT